MSYGINPFYGCENIVKVFVSESETEFAKMKRYFKSNTTFTIKINGILAPMVLQLKNK